MITYYTFLRQDTHWEELLQSVSDFIFCKHYGCTPRGVRGVKRSGILWEIQKCSSPGRPSSQNWIKSKRFSIFWWILMHILLFFLFKPLSFLFSKCFRWFLTPPYWDNILGTPRTSNFFFCSLLKHVLCMIKMVIENCFKQNSIYILARRTFTQWMRFLSCP